MKVSQVFARQLLNRLRRRSYQRRWMVRAVDSALELFRREKLRNGSLKLELGQRARFELIDFGLRERWIANRVRKQVQCLVQILHQTTRADGTR